MVPTVGPMAANGPDEPEKPAYIPPAAHTLLPIEVNDNPMGWNYFGTDMIDIQRKVHLKRQERELQKLETMYQHYPEYLEQLKQYREMLAEAKYVLHASSLTSLEEKRNLKKLVRTKKLLLREYVKKVKILHFISMTPALL